MTDRPINFRAPEILALLAGRKTQHRAIIKPQPCVEAVAGRFWVRENWRTPFVPDIDVDGQRRAPPAAKLDPELTTIEYAADGKHTLNAKTRSSIHMPRWASRLTLIVESVKVERLQDISAEDAIAEGIYYDPPTAEDYEWNACYCEENGGDPTEPMEGVWRAPGTRQGWGPTKAQKESEQWGPTAAFAFRCLWNYIHGADAWEANPFVAAIIFRVIKANIDAEAS